MRGTPKDTIRLFLLLAAAAAAAHGAVDAGDAIARQAQEAVGIPYRFGRADARATDCAGLTRRVAASAGVELPRTSREQFAAGVPVNRDELQPGDLVFFRNTWRPGISHVGIYIGEGRFVHAASRQGQVVIDHLDEPYYAARFAGGRRITD